MQPGQGHQRYRDAMADEGLGPDHLSTRGLPSARRGYDKKAVTRLLREAAEAWSELERRHADLEAEIEKTGGIDYLARDLGQIGADVGAILAAAREAAEGMRSRASSDAERRDRESVEEAARVVAEAAKEAAAVVEEAERQAHDMRSDAWETGTSLLEGAKAMSSDMVNQAGEDVLIVRAEAERESHRRVAQARKEGDDIIRNARFEADRMVNQARQMADELIENARRDSEAAQERTRALEGRRKELLDEIDSARSDAITGIRVLDPEPPKRSDPVDPERPVSYGELDPAADGLSEAMAAEVGRIVSEPELDEPETPPEPVEVATVELDDSDAADEAPTADEEPVVEEASDDGDDGEDPVVVSPSVTVLPGAGGGVHALFDRLRTTAEQDVAVETPTEDALALRDRLVIPVYNLGLREAKRRIVDLQNVALDQLRTEGSWEPDADAIEAALAPGMEPMVQKAASAGVRGAATLGGGRTGKAEPGRRPAATIAAMAADLAGQLRGALSEANGGGPREIASTVSRVFRAWRTDEGERWVRTVAYAAYHDSMITALAGMEIPQITGVPAAATCDQCAAPTDAVWSPGEQPPEGLAVPPATSSCSCTVAPAS